MPIVTLLREWSELEPERCSYVGGIFAIRGWTLTHEEEVTERLVNSEIQCAVQEAIEAKEWNWYLGRVTIDEGIYYKSKIVLPASDAPASAPKLNIFLSTHSPTHVLLQAYLQALAIINTGKSNVENRALESNVLEHEGSEPAHEAGEAPLQTHATVEAEVDEEEAPALSEEDLLQLA